MQTAAPTVRRHDLDWLRVIVFGILIVWHVAVAFVDWDVYAYRSNVLAGSWLESVLVFVHQWRLPSLFLISGMGTAFAFRHRSGGQFLGERAKRLLIPLLFGSVVVNLASGYFGMLASGGAESFFDFTADWVSHLGDVQHLWFLVNLFIYSLVATPLFLHMRKRPDGLLSRSVRSMVEWGEGWGLLLIVPIPLVLIELFIKPWSYGIAGSGYEFFWYFGLFLIGFALITAEDRFWDVLGKVRYPALITAVIATVVLFWLRAQAGELDRGYAYLLLDGGWAAYGLPFWGSLTFPAGVLHTLNSWAWCLSLFAWAARYLDRPSRSLTYFNRAVYPFYIVHMPILLVALYYVRDWDLWWGAKFVLLNAVTFAGCWAVFEVVKRTKLSRALFGIKELR